MRIFAQISDILLAIEKRSKGCRAAAKYLCLFLYLFYRYICNIGNIGDSNIGNIVVSSQTNII